MLDEMSDFDNKISPLFVLENLGDRFTYGELKRAVEVTRKTHQLSPEKELIINHIMWLALSHYEIDFSLDSAISTIFPRYITATRFEICSTTAKPCEINK